MSIILGLLAAATAVTVPPLDRMQQLELCIQRAEMEITKKVDGVETVDKLIAFLAKSGYSAGQIADVLETCHSFEVGRNYQKFVYQGPKT